MAEPPLEPSGPDPLSPEEAFCLLGNDTRVGILQALWDAFESGTGDNAVPFSELYAAVDVRDSGNFSYHLEKLVGPFVRSTDEGYELKQTGINVVRAVVAGTVTDDPSFGPTEVEVDCPLCGAPVEVAYADEFLSVRCTACEGTRRWRGEDGLLFGALVPPACFEGQSVEEAFHAAVAHTAHQAASLADGVCPHCASAPETWIDACTDHRADPADRCPSCGRAHATECWMVCSNCKRSMFPPVRFLVLDDPDVTAFYREHGIRHDVATWDGVARGFEIREEVVSEEPLQLRLRVPAGDDELVLTVDEEANVVDVAG